MADLRGVYRAVCLEVTDDRVRCKVPQLFADEVVTCFDVAGSVPVEGVEGFVAFESGWADRPVWLGGQWEILVGGGTGGGVTDHGLLTGLARDDHTQYLKPTEVLAGTNVTVDRTTTPGSVIIASSGGGGTGTTAPNEVVISTDDPIVAYPEAELWYDPDAVDTGGGSTFPGYGVVPAETTFGISKTDGTATTVARSDHTHGSPTHDATAHSAIPVSALAVPTVDVAWNSKKITGLANPSSAQDAATKSYVDGITVTSHYRVEERSTSTSTPISATTAETTIVSPTFDPITTGERIKFRAWGDTLNNSGGTATVKFFIRYASLTGTLILDTGTSNLVTAGTRYPWLVELEIETTTPASDNDFIGKALVGTAAASTRMGTTTMTAVGVNPGVALDLSSAFQLFLTGQLSVSTSTDLRIQGYSIERFV